MSGFTLVELIIVVTIIAVLSTVSYISYSQYSKEAENTKNRMELESKTSEIEYDLLKETSFPTSSITN